MRGSRSHHSVLLYLCSSPYSREDPEVRAVQGFRGWYDPLVGSSDTWRGSEGPKTGLKQQFLVRIYNCRFRKISWLLIVRRLRAYWCSSLCIPVPCLILLFPLVLSEQVMIKIFFPSLSFPPPPFSIYSASDIWYKKARQVPPGEKTDRTKLRRSIITNYNIRRKKYKQHSEDRKKCT